MTRAFSMSSFDPQTSDPTGAESPFEMQNCTESNGAATSLGATPSAVAALKNESDISVGNVIGSNLCNALFIIGVVGLVFELPVDARSLTFDFPIMIGFTVVLYPIMRTGFYIGRMKGGFLLLSYASYVLALFLFR